MLYTIVTTVIPTGLEYEVMIQYMLHTTIAARIPGDLVYEVMQG